MYSGCGRQQSIWWSFVCECVSYRFFFFFFFLLGHSVYTHISTLDTCPVWFICIDSSSLFVKPTHLAVLIWPFIYTLNCVCLCGYYSRLCVIYFLSFSCLFPTLSFSLSLYFNYHTNIFFSFNSHASAFPHMQYAIYNGSFCFYWDVYRLQCDWQ